MRRPAAATSRVRRSGGAPVTLFPFLAVLMCTMGALALLLVVINRHSRVLAITAARNVAAAATAAHQDDEIQTERESVEWRVSQLQASRQQTEAQLAEARWKLAHLEDHARRLRDQVSQLQANLRELEGLANGQRRKEAETELQRLKGQLLTADQQLAEARRAAQDRPRSYAVIPYDGPNPTGRRPMYVECRADALVLQPEGIVLTADDFDGPLGPGNPLDVGLRAMQESLLRGVAAQDLSQEPYPLFLVRPDGVEAYYAARAATMSWGSEFGYELIGQDWKLQFPKPDAQLADTVREAVASARVRQQRLVAAAPRQYGSRTSSAKYRAAPFRGGIVRDSEPAQDDRPGYQSRSAAGRMAKRVDPEGASSGPPSGTSAGAAEDERLAAAAMSDPRRRPVTSGGSPRPEGYVTGRPPREGEMSKEEAASQKTAIVLRPGEWVEKPPPPRKTPDEQKEKKKKEKVRSLAETRGRDWGLPDAARGSVGVTRPVRIDCHQDRLVIAPDQGTAGGKSIPLGERTETSVDAFISAVWEYMDSWGIAGKGMYWKPVLSVHVVPNGEARYDELKTLLDGSGLDVKRRHEG